MDGNSLGMGQFEDFAHLHQWVNPATLHIVCVFECNQTCPRQIIEFGTNGSLEVTRREKTVLRRDGAWDHTRKSGHHPHLVVEDMTAFFEITSSPGLV